MTVTETENAPAVGSAELYQQVQQFYAQQMQLLDSGRVGEWAETFTEGGVFAANAKPEPTTGRTAIAAVAGQVTDEYARMGVQRRHWMGMVAIDGVNGDRVKARSYALVIETKHGGKPYIKASTTCEDVLVRVGGRWLVEHRLISRDDLV
ncbi:nuclear transport factor 2 family protein [Streptomyces rimosus]|uniref:nuclear transport factor 2 family protein n=1 Tax=Streptomyces rimosus TaxID=1927 RepID=UPI0004CC65E0|nr:nuclear transport factor 2 family protein [Streptomyces rimosus]